ncbi:MAG TPA: 1-pyrroline-5-carboxylate dehydrogenase, partial [Bacteroidales bacterium]|nr:1-pyrroline-5-carboxylate dehydrogenase [Bacteroidales bacterium]
QKCSAASRAYIPKNRWAEVWKEMQEDLTSIKMGGPENFTNFVNAVIDEASFEKISGFIKRAETSKDAKVVAGGTYDKSVGYFIKPTVILTTNPHYETMEEEIFGPILTVYLYDENKWEETVTLVDNTSIYALTGSIFSQDRYAIEYASKHLRNAAGNFYINDKPTGAVVNQQPFGGARASGTNDKAGSSLNLLRWVSPRSIKETFLPAVSYKYPFMVEKQVCECGEREIS